MRKKKALAKRQGLQKHKDKNRAFVASTAFVSFLLLVSFLLVFLVFRDNRGFEVMLQEIDQIQQHNIPTLRLYQDIARKAKNEREYLRILKRAYQIPNKKLRNQYLIDVTMSAVKKLPDSENLWAHRVSALLGEGLFIQDTEN